MNSSGSAMAEMEQLCMAAMSGGDGRSSAEQRLVQVAQNPENLEMLLEILINSNVPYAQHFAASSLTTLMTKKWASFSAGQKYNLRSRLLAMFSQRGPELPPFVLNSGAELLARITKMAWFDSPKEVTKSLPYQDIYVHVSSFWEVSVGHLCAGLALLNELIMEMHSNRTLRTLAKHRRVAMSFRDNCLLSIFNGAVKSLERIRSGTIPIPSQQIRDKLVDLSLKVCLSCLSFDFIGTAIEESVEEISTVQVPASWKDLFETSSLLDLFFEVYASQVPPRSSLALQCIVYAASVRRSIFPSQEKRSSYMGALVAKTVTVLKGNTGLHEQENFHEFCKLLSRIKINCQLPELSALPDFLSWVRLSASITVQSFNSLAFAGNSMYYLVLLWSRMATSTSYHKQGEALDELRRVLPDIFIAICNGLESWGVQSVNGADGDPCEGLDMFLNHLDMLPHIARVDYTKSSERVCTMLDHVIGALQSQHSTVQQGNVGASVINAEAAGAWLLYVVGAVIQNRQTSDTAEKCDGELAARAFQLIQWMEVREQALAAGCRDGIQVLERFEKAGLMFLSLYRRTYIGDQATVSSNHLLQILETRLGVPDHNAVLTIMVNRILLITKTWGTSSVDLLDQAFNLLSDLAHNYGSARALLKLEPVNQLLSLPQQPHIASLQPMGKTARLRTSLFSTLARLLGHDDGGAKLETFLGPHRSLFEQLGQFVQSAPQGQIDSHATSSITALMRDLRGVASACLQRRTYNSFFEWVFPDFLPLLAPCLRLWAPNPSAAHPIMKFLCELVHNKNQRIVFDCSSANGILLFREASACIVAYGNYLSSIQIPNNNSEVAWTNKFRGVMLILKVMERTFKGNYVNFGVFQLYGDRALQDAIQTSMSLISGTSTEDILSFPKLAKVYYSFVLVLCQSHIEMVVSMDSQSFARILLSLQQGLKSSDTAITTDCASSLDIILSWRINAKPRKAQLAQQYDQHMAEQPQIIPSLLSQLLDTIVFEECPNQWSMSRPLLCLIILSGDGFNQAKQQIISSVSESVQDKIQSAFDGLMRDVNNTLEGKNRDVFTQKMTVFRQEVKTILV